MQLRDTRDSRTKSSICIPPTSSTTVATQRHADTHTHTHTPGPNEKGHVCQEKRERILRGLSHPLRRHLPFRANQLHSRPAALFLVNTKRHRELWGFHQPPNGFAATREPIRSKRFDPRDEPRVVITCQEKVVPTVFYNRISFTFPRPKNASIVGNFVWTRIRKLDGKR